MSNFVFDITIFAVALLGMTSALVYMRAKMIEAKAAAANAAGKSRR